MNHHVNIAGNGCNRWEVARPARDSSWWRRWKLERACRKQHGHCWHPDSQWSWWCCMCSGETEGMPAQNCKHCLAAKQQRARSTR